MSEYVAIGEYQLANLLRNRVKFTYVDLTTDAERATKPAAWFAGGLLAADPEAAVRAVRTAGVTADGAIVLICGNGAKSVAAAGLLAKESYINVFVIEGGAASLPDQAPE